MRIIFLQLRIGCQKFCFCAAGADAGGQGQRAVAQIHGDDLREKLRYLDGDAVIIHPAVFLIHGFPENGSDFFLRHAQLHAAQAQVVAAAVQFGAFCPRRQLVVVFRDFGLFIAGYRFRAGFAAVQEYGDGQNQDQAGRQGQQVAPAFGVEAHIVGFQNQFVVDAADAAEQSAFRVSHRAIPSCSKYFLRSVRRRRSRLLAPPSVRPTRLATRVVESP